jgi:ring-1,2-phenylacetyl-CoA epoxidase subunit PaaD
MVILASGQRDEAMRALRSVKDPELPAVDVVELGIVREVEVSGESVRVDITPTYSGCPAMQIIEADIVSALDAAGFRDVEVRTIYSPAWSSDWITEEAREKLRASGIAPPHLRGPSAVGRASLQELVTLTRAPAVIECPFCASDNTVERSQFGSTACKAIHFCNNCKQPFDYFKEF